jgi:hypothetical protein
VVEVSSKLEELSDFFQLVSGKFVMVAKAASVAISSNLYFDGNG